MRGAGRGSFNGAGSGATMLATCTKNHHTLAVNGWGRGLQLWGCHRNWRAKAESSKERRREGAHVEVCLDGFDGGTVQHLGGSDGLAVG